MPRRHTRPPFCRILRAAGGLFTLLALASTAHARVETLQWEHPNPSVVDGFRVYVGSSSGDYARRVDAGKPVPDSNGIFEFDLSVTDGSTVYVAVAAYQDDGTESALSNERVREPPTSGDGSTDDSTGTDGSGGTDDSSGTDGSGSTGSDTGLSETFESQALGTAVSGWVDTEAHNSLVENDALFSVADLNGSRVLTTSSTATDIHSHYVGSSSADWAGYEVSGRMRGSASSSRLGVTAYSGYDLEDVYYRLGTHWQTAELEIYRHPTPDGTFSCTSAGTGVPLQEDRWYRFRLQVEPVSAGTRVRAKVWPAGQAEPTSWPALCVDERSDPPGSGTIGVWSGNGGAKYWDDLVVGPVGGSGPLTPPGQPTLVME